MDNTMNNTADDFFASLLEIGKTPAPAAPQHVAIPWAPPGRTPRTSTLSKGELVQIACTLARARARAAREDTAK